MNKACKACVNNNAALLCLKNTFKIILGGVVSSAVIGVGKYVARAKMRKKLRHGNR